MLRSILVIVFFTQTCLAAGITIEPENADITKIQQIFSGEISYASGDVSGKGSDLIIDYSSSDKVELFIMFVDKRGNINPREIVYAELPEGITQATIPISKTRGWKNGERTYKLHFIKKEESDTVINNAQIAGGFSFSNGIKQLFTPEPFTPSSYHRLSGYRIFGYSLTLIVTIIIALAFITCISLKRKRLGIIIVITGILILNTRFSLDLIKYTHTNLTSETYATAGSAYDLAGFLKSQSIESVQLCSDSNSYFRTIFNYAAYPMVIDDKSEYVIVHNALDCELINESSTLIKEFPDGSILYKLSK